MIKINIQCEAGKLKTINFMENGNTGNILISLSMKLHDISCLGMLIFKNSRHAVVQGTDHFTVLKFKDTEYLNEMLIRVLRDNDV
jgi:hypothetical protein